MQQANPSDSATARPPTLADASVVAFVALLVYLCLGQDALYKRDAPSFVRDLAAGKFWHPLHALYLPILQAFRAVLAPLGLPIYRVATVASAVGSAAGVLACHLAGATLRLSRGRALGLACLVALCPAVVFFATIVEIHGVFFAFVGLAWLCAARLAVVCSPARALALGFATGLASLVHATGHLCLPLCALFVVVERRGRALRGVLSAAAAHAGFVLAAGGILPFFGLARSPGDWLGGQLGFLGGTLGRLQDPSRLPLYLWHEWVYAFAAVSLLWLAAFARRGQRLGASLQMGAVCCWVVLAFVLIPGEFEYGAYALPLAFLAALLSLRSLPLGVCLGSAPLALVLAVLLVRGHDRPIGSPTYARNLAIATAGARPPVLLMGSADEIHALLRQAPEQEWLPVYEWLGPLEAEPERAEAWHRGVDQLLAAVREKGRDLYLTRGIVAELGSARAPPAAARLLAHLRREYRWLRVAAGSFVAWRIEPRP